MTRPTRFGRPSSRQTMAGIGLIAALLLVATVVIGPWKGPAPSASPGRSAAASPSASPESWAALEPPEIPVVATLAPTQLDDAGVQPASAFTLVSRSGEPASAIAARLQVTPAIDFTLSATGDPTRALLIPVTLLAAGQAYRFALRSPDGALAGSWAFQVRGPLHALSSLPGDRTTNVPVNTGIEVAFDQDGAASIADYFSISPAVEGRFESHGRTQVFVPNALKSSTLYTVTIRAGLPKTGSDLSLESDVVFQFETAGTTVAAAYLRMGRDVIENRATDVPLLAVEVEQPGAQPGPVPTSAEIVVYRFPSEASATTALGAFLKAPRWTQYADPLMPTAGLPATARFSASLESSDDTPARVIRFPEPLANGWYLLEIRGQRPSQAFLQVTSVSAWVSVSWDQTIVWVNDVSSGRAITGATVEIAGSAAFGTSVATGIIDARTPNALLPPGEARGAGVPATAPILVVRSPGAGAVLVPFDVPFLSPYRGEWWEQQTASDSTYWSLLSTDRGLYRGSDSVRAWGYLRARDGGAVPPRVELQIVPQASAGLANPPVLIRGQAIPGPTGAFTSELKYEGAPLGYYDLRAVVDGRVVMTRSIEITVIRKPTYQLALATDHTAILAGASIRWTATATFFDGTAVPALPLLASSYDGEVAISPTDPNGSSTGQVTPKTQQPDGFNPWRHWGLSVNPAVGEEGEISAEALVIVFPSSDHLQASAKLTASQLNVTGSVHEVDLAKVEKAQADGTWNGDPSGRPISRRSVRVTVTEIVPIRRQIGTYYDFIEKVTKPRYQYDSERKAVKTLEVVAGSAGSFAFSLTIPDPSHQYEIALSSTDSQGRVELRTVYAGQAFDFGASQAGVRFEPTSADEAGDAGYDVGAKIAWRITDNGQPSPSGGQNRYLYIVSQRGVVNVAASSLPSFSRTFGAADAPGIFVMGVRFTGQTYAPKAASWAHFDAATRKIGVIVSADRPRYRPGDDAKLTVQTTNDAGRPIAATVVLQAVDEKLFAIGAALVPQPLEELYAGVDSGIVRLTSTHQVPTFSGSEGEGGDTTGGGGDEARTDFRDTLAFLAITTGADGRATTTVHLSDDLTAWHVSAVALTAGLQAGVGDLLIQVGLPLFADVTIADSYLVSDQPIIRLRAYGLALQPSDPVEFTVSAPSLGLGPTVVKATAFSAVPLALPSLSVGRHEVRVAVVAPTRTDAAGAPLRDALVRTFEVVSSRVTALQTWYGAIGGTLPAVPATAAAATYTFSDAGRGRFLPFLLQGAEPRGGRLDDGLAQHLARDLLIREFGFDPASLPQGDFRRYVISSAYGGNVMPGVALLPYSGPDPWLAARAAVMAPDALNRGELRDALLVIRDGKSTNRDLRVAAVAGLAALGEPVLTDLVGARAAPDLSVTERLYLGLGFAAIGDDASARQIERALIVEYGRRLGPWTRLQAGTTPSEIAEQTALLAVLAASLGDPLTPAILEYVAANPSTETSNDLELASAAARIIERTSASAAAFTYTVEGKRSEVALTPGNAVTFVLTSAQRATLRLEAQSGTVGVAVAWRQPVNVGSLVVDPNLGLLRTVPTGPVSQGQLVTVDMIPTFLPSAARGDCYLVVEEVPSGLAPLPGAWDAASPSVTWPSRVVGQQVTFCASNPIRQGTNGHLRYVARIVTAGTYTWEPAVMQFGQDARSMVITRADTITIRN